MIATDRYPDVKKARWFSIPLTLAAAMIAVVIAGGVLLSMNSASPNPAFVAQPQPSATPIMSPTLVPSPTPIVGTLPAVIVSVDGMPVTLYAGPSENDDAVISHLDNGISLEVVGRTDDSVWLYVRTREGLEGWIKSGFAQLPGVPVIQSAQVELMPDVLPTPSAAALASPVVNEVVTVVPTVEPPVPAMEITLLPAVDLQPVVIALQDIPASTLITEDMVAVVYWPLGIVPEGVFSISPTLIGNMTTTVDIARWQPILLEDIGSQLSAVLPPGKVAVALPLEPSQAAMSWLQEGSADIYAAMLFVDADEQFPTLAGTPPSANFPTPVPGQEPQLVTQRVVNDAQVIHIGSFGQTAQTEEFPDIITLAVSPQDATVLTWMVEARLPIVFLPHDAEPVNLQFGSEITLLGYTTDHQKGLLRFTLYWYAHEQPTADYSLSVNVVNEAREIVVQHDSALLDAAGNPTSQWEHNAIVANESTLDFAEAPGDYTVSIALFRTSDGVRLLITSPAASEDNHVEDNLLLLYSFTQE